MRFLTALYRAALRGYPAAFRREFATEMERDFAEGCREARRARHLPVYLLHIAADTVGGIFREGENVMDRKRFVLYAAAVAVSAAFAVFDANTKSDDTGILAGILLCLAVPFGFIEPRQAWRWGVLLGLGVPCWYFLRVGLGITPPDTTQPAFAFFIPLLPALLGAYAGALLRRIVLPPTVAG